MVVNVNELLSFAKDAIKDKNKSRLHVRIGNTDVPVSSITTDEDGDLILKL